MRTSDKDIQERVENIIKYVGENKDVAIDDIANYFSVSTMTIRRNLRDLQDEDIIDIKNGTVFLKERYQAKWTRLKTNDQRENIQKTAAEMVEANDVIYINTGYTVAGIVQYIKNKPCTIITNNINIYNIERDSNIKVIFTGGELHQKRSSMVGEQAIKFLRYNRANKAFVGCSSINLDDSRITGGGLYGSDISEASITQEMIENCSGKVILCATSDKFSTNAPFFIDTLSSVDTIITDGKINILNFYELRDNIKKNMIIANK